MLRHEQDSQRLYAQGADALAYLVRGRRMFEEAEIRRAFHAAGESYTDSLDTTWWQVFSAATVSFGMRPSVLDCSVDQAMGLVRDGGDLVFFGGEPNRWGVIRGSEKGSARLWNSEGESELRRKNQIRAAIAGFAQDNQLRCVALDRWDSTVGAATKVKPLDRLKQVLRPEWPDIWLVVLFAFVVGLLGLATPIAVEALVNTVAFGRYLQPIVVLAGLLFFFLAFSASIQALQTYVVEIIQQRLFARVAADLAHRLPRVTTEASDEHSLPQLSNYFFDVVTLQKVSAKLLLDSVSLVLSVAIGMMVLGFYHPFLLGFDLVLLASITFMIVALGRGAVRSAVKESKGKYSMAAWLQDVARCETTFRSAHGKQLSASRADLLVEDYLRSRKTHFRILFRQIVFALALYAVASTVLLGLGGWLVVAGELTLGQLVAAELIVAVIVRAFSKLGKHLESFYDVLASVDKLGVLFDLPTEKQSGILSSFVDEPVALQFEGVVCQRDGTTPFEPLIGRTRAGDHLAILGPSASGKSTLLDLIDGRRHPTDGRLLVNGHEPTDVQSDDYRSHVELIRRGEVFSGTLAENVHLHRPHISRRDVIDALQAVGLADLVAERKDGLETKLSYGGRPLTSSQVNLLLLARALAAAPALLLVDGLLDELSDDELDHALDLLLAPERGWTVVVSTGRRRVAGRFESLIHLPVGKFETGPVDCETGGSR